jgi:predicted ATP-dependent Lon-type protease
MKEIWKECTEYLDTIEGKFNKVPKHHILDLAENVDEVLKACDAFINDCSCLLECQIQEVLVMLTNSTIVLSSIMHYRTQPIYS